MLASVTIIEDLEEIRTPVSRLILPSRLSKKKKEKKKNKKPEMKINQQSMAKERRMDILLSLLQPSVLFSGSENTSVASTM
jgi:hypothetical protein